MKITRLATALALAAGAALPAAAQTAGRSTPAAAAQGTGVKPILDRAAAAYKRIRSTRADFEQTLTNPLTGRSTVQNGQFAQQAKSWSARFTNPQGDRYVLNGRTFWIYTPSSAPRQAIRINVDADAVQSFDIARQLAGDPSEQYRITTAGTASVGGRPAHALQMVPKTPGRLSKATVWVDDQDGTVRQFEITEQTGLVRRVRLSNVRLNTTIPAAEFAFTPPAGVRVIDQAELAGEP